MTRRRLTAKPEALARRRRSVPVNVMVEPDFYVRIKVCCEQHGIPMRELVEKALDYAMRDPARVLTPSPDDGSVEDRLRMLEADVDMLKQQVSPPECPPECVICGHKGWTHEWEDMTNAEQDAHKTNQEACG